MQEKTGGVIICPVKYRGEIHSPRFVHFVHLNKLDTFFTQYGAGGMITEINTFSTYI